MDRELIIGGEKIGIKCSDCKRREKLVVGLLLTHGTGQTTHTRMKCVCRALS